MRNDFQEIGKIFEKGYSFLFVSEIKRKGFGEDCKVFGKDKRLFPVRKIGENFFLLACPVG